MKRHEHRKKLHLRQDMVRNLVKVDPNDLRNVQGGSNVTLIHCPTNE